jgi:hypothetical protein
MSLIGRYLQFESGIVLSFTASGSTTTKGPILKLPLPKHGRPAVECGFFEKRFGGLSSRSPSIP